jgi:MoaA/NifB/PqqE/SkfB family radical SAM enzyme
VPRLEDLKTVVIEGSSRCNAACPFCSRQVMKREYPPQDITLDDFRRLPLEEMTGLRQISFAGNFGDSACNKDMPAIAAHARALRPELKLFMDTNGSVQSEDWWERLGASFAQGVGFVSFAVDGLADTHALHRKRTDFHKIIANMKAFIGGGGTAYWKCIVFAHNEHQVPRARDMAEAMGCARFFAIPSRFYNDELKPPLGVEYTQRDPLYESHWGEVRDEDARCRPFHNRSVYIGADGTVLPCCYAHVQWFARYREEFAFMEPLLARHYDAINMKTNGFREIVEGPFLPEVRALARRNRFCQLKCNPFTKQVRADVLIEDVCFAGDCLS